MFTRCTGCYVRNACQHSVTARKVIGKCSGEVLSICLSPRLMQNDAFVSVMQKSMATAMSATTGVELAEDAVSIDNIAISRRARRGRRRLRVKAVGSGPKNLFRSLQTTEDKTLQVEFSIMLPQGTTAADVAKVKDASSSGGDGSTGFASALKTAVNEEVANSPELAAMGISAKAVMVTGTAETTTTVVTTTVPPPISDAEKAKAWLKDNIGIIPFFETFSEHRKRQKI